MRTEMRDSMKRALITMTRNEAPMEICGFIRRSALNENDEWVIHPITNVAQSPNNFEMDERELIKFYEDYLHLAVGMYHSHPRGRIDPSTSDREHAPDNMRYWIVTSDGVYEWDMSDEQPLAVS